MHMYSYPRAGEPEPSEPGVFGSLEPEPAEKKPGDGAGAAKNIPFLYRLLEDKKNKEIVHLFLFFR